MNSLFSRLAGSGQKQNLTLRNRYKIQRSQVVGAGSSAIVYKGLDSELCRNVAVKLYQDVESSGLDEFRKNVNILQILSRGRDGSRDHHRRSFDCTLLEDAFVSHAKSVRTNDEWEWDADLPGAVDPESPRGPSPRTPKAEVLDSVLDDLDVSRCYVSLLDHSKDACGNPGLEADEGVLFIIMDLGEESLKDRLENYRSAGRTFTVNELRQIQWALATIVWGLHAVGFVHMDIKPANIMYFKSVNPHIPGQWKLIDLDGCSKTGQKIQVSDVTYTPEYMPPELANAFMRTVGGKDTRSRSASPAEAGDGRDGVVRPSRIMDVWSIGMCSLEAIFLQPVLAPWYSEWTEATGSEQKFYRWLGDYTTEPILSGDMREAISAIDEDMCDLLSTMLVKDPSDRRCIAHCLVHKWFEPIRTKSIEQLTANRQVAKLASTELSKDHDRAFQKTVHSVVPSMSGMPAVRSSTGTTKSKVSARHGSTVSRKLDEAVRCPKTHHAWDNPTSSRASGTVSVACVVM
mmetsp:Transcript_55121/g.118317  ORF Transcript_55121/g.118317 Transcript_55121/m.118317 type:complete len:516 (+) Transcript_55121:128-1675(+)